jgi:hypothetical protein
MRRFKWIEWNLHKIAVHALSVEEVEAVYSRVNLVVEWDHDRHSPDPYRTVGPAS